MKSTRFEMKEGFDKARKRAKRNTIAPKASYENF